MVQPGQDRNGDNGAKSLDGSMHGRLLTKRTRALSAPLENRPEASRSSLSLR